MRKVTFYIDEAAYWDKIGSSVDEELLNDAKVFSYIVYGNGNTPKMYELIDCEGNAFHIDDLDDFQRYNILGDCNLYFKGEPLLDGAIEPFGVMKIDDCVVE